ncbi:MAG: thioredoxin reductase, partial [Baekduia sp.]|nr:thioredoxin reductase [Baekduia sp.]
MSSSPAPQGADSQAPPDAPETDSAALNETPDVYGAYPRLTDQQIAALAAVGVPRQVKPGDVLYREGDGGCEFFVIIEGKVALVEEFDDNRQVLGVHGPRRFLGELGLITGQ